MFLLDFEIFSPITSQVKQLCKDVYKDFLGNKIHELHVHSKIYLFEKELK
jgi:hypothetical protein